MKSRVDLAKDIMLSQLADYERLNNELIHDLYRVLGGNIDDLLNKIYVLYLQLNIDTATWGLDIWESNLQIFGNENKSYVERRAAIKTKLKAKGKVSTLTLESAIQDYYKGKVDVYFNHKLLFRIPMEGDSGKYLLEVIDTINKLRPSHLGYDIQLYMQPIETTLYWGAYNLSGEEITVLPSPTRDIEANPYIYISVAYEGIAENVTLQSTDYDNSVDMKLGVDSLGNLINQLEQVVIHSNKGGGIDV